MRFILSFILTAGTLGAFVGYGLIPVANEALVIIGTAALAWVALPDCREAVLHGNRRSSELRRGVGVPVERHPAPASR